MEKEDNIQYYRDHEQSQEYYRQPVHFTGDGLQIFNKFLLLESVAARGLFWFGGWMRHRRYRSSGRGHLPWRNSEWLNVERLYSRHNQWNIRSDRRTDRLWEFVADRLVTEHRVAECGWLVDGNDQAIEVSGSNMGMHADPGPQRLVNFGQSRFDMLKDDELVR